MYQMPIHQTGRAHGKCLIKRLSELIGAIVPPHRSVSGIMIKHVCAEKNKKRKKINKSTHTHIYRTCLLPGFGKGDKIDLLYHADSAEVPQINMCFFVLL